MKVVRGFMVGDLVTHGTFGHSATAEIISFKKTPFGDCLLKWSNGKTTTAFMAFLRRVYK